MKLSTLDLNRIKALHYLLEEAHVGRAALRLGITSAAASNALRRLREEFGDPLLIRQGRGLVRTRVGDTLRAAAGDVMAAAERFVRDARAFDPGNFGGQIPIAMSEHVAAVLLPSLDRTVRQLAPHALLAIAPIPLDIADWLADMAGVLVGPTGAFAVSDASGTVIGEPFYEDHYVCGVRAGHPALRKKWDVKAFAALEHVMVLPRGRTQRSDIDDQLSGLGLIRRIARITPSFTLALPLVAMSDMVVSIPALCANVAMQSNVVLRPAPLKLQTLDMTLFVHQAHRGDARVKFTQKILRASLAEAMATRSLVGHDRTRVAHRLRTRKSSTH